MKNRVQRHGPLLGRVALSCAILAVAAMLTAVLLRFWPRGELSDPDPSAIGIAIAVSVVLGIVGSGVGLAVWIVHAPDYYLGMGAVMILAAVMLLVLMFWGSLMWWGSIVFGDFDLL
jgi:preprotein translocase subunit Sec61beta